MQVRIGILARARALLLTPLLALLLTLLATGCSSLDPREAAQTAVSESPEGKKIYVWSRSMEAKRIALERATLNTGIAVLRTRDNQLQVNVPSEFSFDTESAAIKPGMRPVLDHFAGDLETKALAHMLIRIVGHTDSRGADAVNDPLSLARATSVAKYLEAKGIASSRIEVEGRGEHDPLVTNDKDYGRALNRRVEMFLREPAQG